MGGIGALLAAAAEPRVAAVVAASTPAGPARQSSDATLPADIISSYKVTFFHDHEGFCTASRTKSFAIMD